MRARTIRGAAVPLASSGLLMAAYLLLRPYGDQGADPGGDIAAARAMSSGWWVAAHVCGMLAIASFVVAVVQVADVTDGFAAVLARWTGLGGLVLVLPYYGAETFALHVVARDALSTEGSGVGLLAGIREQPVAMTMFAIGLLLLAVSGLALAQVWQSTAPSLALAGWPLGVLVALFLPQFYLPAAGRMAYGLAYLAAALLLAVAVRRGAGRVATDGGALSEAPATIAR